MKIANIHMEDESRILEGFDKVWCSHHKIGTN
jgi:hypothetical protein